MTSVVPPGANGMIMRKGWVGNACDHAAQGANRAAAARAPLNFLRWWFMRVSWMRGGLQKSRSRCFTSAVKVALTGACRPQRAASRATAPLITSISLGRRLS